MRWIQSARFGPFALTLGLGFLALRLFALTADPPARLVSHYQDVAFSVFDEGWWTANAREAVRFGARLGTGFDLFWVSPVFTLWMTAVFSVLGPSLATARLASIAAGAAGLWLLLAAGRGRDAASDRAVRIAALLWVVSFAGGLLGRLALPETFGTTLGLAGAVALLRGGRAGNAGAGALAALAALTKPQLAFLIPAFLIAGAWLAVRRSRPVFGAVGFGALGVSVPLVIWGGYVAAHAAPALELARFYLDSRWFAGSPPAAGGALAFAKPLIQTAVAGVVYRHAFLVHLPGVFLLAWLAVPGVLEAARRPRATSVPDVVVVFGAWAIIGGLAISAIPFQPFRYYLPLAPALAVLAAWCLSRDADPAEVGRGRWRRVWTWAASSAVLVQVVFAAAVATCLPSLVARATERVALLDPVEFGLTPFLLDVVRSGSLASFAELPRELAYVAALALLAVLSLGAVVLVALAAARLFARGFDPPGERAGPILGLLVAYQLLLWLAWAPERAATLRDMGRTLDTLLPPSATVSPGGTYSLESELRFDSRAVRERRMFDATGEATHFVVLGSHPLIGALPEGEIERRWPGSERIATFDLTGDYVYYLYRTAADRRRE